MKYPFFYRDLGSIPSELLGYFQAFSKTLEYKTMDYFRNSKNILVSQDFRTENRLIGWLVNNRLNHLFDPSKFKSANFDNLIANSYIQEHNDMEIGSAIETTHKIHIPLITNPGCGSMWSAGKRTTTTAALHMEVGHVYMYNNVDLHSVVNLSPEDRIHLILRFEKDAPLFDYAS